MKRYLVLWDMFGNKEFTFDGAQKTLDEDSRIVSLFLSQLNKEKWVTIKIHPDDARKRIYTLKPYDKIFEEVIKTGVSS